MSIVGIATSPFCSFTREHRRPQLLRSVGLPSARRRAAELLAVQGKPVDIGGYNQPADKKPTAALRPSKTLNDILATL